MKLGNLTKRIATLEPEPVDRSELEELENDRILFQAFVPCYLEHLQKLEIPFEIIEETRASLETTGPRPFGHDRPDDRPYWVPLDEVIGAYWSKYGWRMKAAQFLAWADIFTELADHEEAAKYRQLAEEHLAYERK